MSHLSVTALRVRPVAADGAEKLPPDADLLPSCSARSPKESASNCITQRPATILDSYVFYVACRRPNPRARSGATRGIKPKVRTAREPSKGLLAASRPRGSRAPQSRSGLPAGVWELARSSLVWKWASCQSGNEERGVTEGRAQQPVACAALPARDRARQHVADSSCPRPAGPVCWGR